MRRKFSFPDRLSGGTRLRIAVALSLAFAALQPASALPSAPPAPSAPSFWLEPTGGPYPKPEPGAKIWLKVSLDRQRVYVMSGDGCVYTMIASTGLDSPEDDRTPQGVFYVQRERGLSFYSARLGEGARYWVSWLHHGEYLFHSVPTDAKGRIVEEEASKLGRKASHGCIRLSLPDAKWIYDNVRFGAKVVIGP
jgi:lipoprotein-anchoring transpeptidase ErfK/SrfK